MKLALAAAAVLLAPAVAQAQVDASLYFTGKASPGASGSVFPNAQGNTSVTSFAGQPVSISMTLRGPASEPYVIAFSISWSEQTYSEPFVTGWSGPGFPNDPYYSSRSGYYSTVDLTSTGGSIHIYPTPGEAADMNQPFVADLNFNFVKGAPFSGSGNANFGFTVLRSPPGRSFTTTSNVPFILTGGTQVGSVPEPSAWLMMVLGTGALGLALRVRRTRLAGAGAAA
jgi:hypothetical protein